jgi:hypothetical protein
MVRAMMRVLYRSEIWSCVVFFSCALAGCRSGGSEASGHGGATLSGPSDIGVPECDSYMQKYEQCLDHAPSEKQRALKDNLDRTRSAWKALASNPGVRPGLAQSCSLAYDTARTALTEYGCTW